MLFGAVAMSAVFARLCGEMGVRSSTVTSGDTCQLMGLLIIYTPYLNIFFMFSGQG